VDDFLQPLIDYDGDCDRMPKQMDQNDLQNNDQLDPHHNFTGYFSDHRKP